MGSLNQLITGGGPTICSYLWILGFHMVAIMEEISYKFLQSVWILLNQVVHKESHTAGILFFGNSSSPTWSLLQLFIDCYTVLKSNVKPPTNP